MEACIWCHGFMTIGVNVMAAMHILCYVPILPLAYQTIKDTAAISASQESLPMNDKAMCQHPGD